MLKRSGPFNKKQLIEAAKEYLNVYTDGRVPYEDLDTGKVCWVVFERVGVVYLFKEIVKG